MRIPRRVFSQGSLQRAPLRDRACARAFVWLPRPGNGPKAQGEMSVLARSLLSAAKELSPQGGGQAKVN
jgi:hypothetical protein